MVKKQQRNIALLGMSDSNISTFTYFLRKHAVEFFQISRPEEADAFIVDYDSAAGITQWKAQCEVSLRPAILLCANDPHKINTIWVKKPVKASQLETAIANLYRLANNPSALHAVVNREQARHDEPALDAHVSSVAKVDTEPGAAPDDGAGKIQAGYQRTFSDESSPNLTLSKEEIIECCGVREDIDPKRADFRAQVSYDDEKTLLAPVKKAIRLAREKHCAVEIRNLHTQIVIMPDGGRIFIDLGNRIIRHMCSMPIQAMPELHVMTLSAVDCERMFPTHHKFMHTTESVLWQLGLWTSRGRLPKGMNPHQALQLAGWPNLTRLEITPHAIHIAALWSKNCLSPVQLATDMHIPQRYVFAFAAAVFAINGFSVAEVDDAMAVSVNKSWKKTQVLFSTILRSLKIAA